MSIVVCMSGVIVAVFFICVIDIIGGETCIVIVIAYARCWCIDCGSSSRGGAIFGSALALEHGKIKGVSGIRLVGRSVMSISSFGLYALFTGSKNRRLNGWAWSQMTGTKCT